MLARRRLAGNPACTDEGPYILQQRQLGAGNAHNRPSAFTAVRARERDGPLAIDDAGDVGSLGWRQFPDERHHRVSIADPAWPEPRIKPGGGKAQSPWLGLSGERHHAPGLSAGSVVTIGGGGGTVTPVAFATAWTMPSSAPLHGVDAERLIPPYQRNPSAHPGRNVHGEPMSLYRAGLRLALFLPLGVAMPLSEESAVRFRRCELRFQPILANRRDPLIEPPSASPRLQDLRT